MNFRTGSLFLRGTLVFWFAASAAAEDWTRFRGPNGSGESDATTIPATWTDSQYKWRVELPGIGHSSPVVWGNRVFVTSAMEDSATRVLRCLDTADGRMVWARDFPSTTYRKHQFNSYAAASPAVDRDRVYAVWTTPTEYDVVALSRETGEEAWRRDLGSYEAQHGSGASPIVVDDLLIVSVDKDRNSFVTALDCATGQTRWKTDTQVQLAGYATPCLFRPEAGPPELILVGSGYGLISLDPKTGKKNWDIAVFKDRVVGSPIVASGLIVAGSGEGGRGTRMVAVRPGNAASGVQPQVAYELKNSLPYVCTPVCRGDLLFLWFDLGVVTCVDAPTGKVHWQERIGGNFFGSPVRVADRLYCVARDGEVVVLAADKQYKLLGRSKLGEASHSTPAVAGGVMYLRTLSHLMAVGGK